jgi:hypothetical protein
MQYALGFIYPPVQFSQAPVGVDDLQRGQHFGSLFA